MLANAILDTVTTFAVPASAATAAYNEQERDHHLADAARHGFRQMRPMGHMEKTDFELAEIWLDLALGSPDAPSWIIDLALIGTLVVASDAHQDADEQALEAAMLRDDETDFDDMTWSIADRRMITTLDHIARYGEVSTED